MTARIITNEGVEAVSDREFFTRAFGHPPRTKAQIAAEWRAKCERYATSIENGFEALVPPPCLRDARKIVEERASKQVPYTRMSIEDRPDGSARVAA
jgi:hypothetical protein